VIRHFGSLRLILISGAMIAGGATACFAQAPPAQTPPAPCGPGLPDMKNIAPDSRCFELRTYIVDPAGPGTLDLLHARFRDHTNKLFIKYGMTIVGFWQSTSPPNTLIYLLAYKDRAARDTAWAGFNKDADWAKVRTAMNVKIGTEAVFMSATDYSPMK
jgi:hypothetical protein